MSDTLGALSGANPIVSNSPAAQQMIASMATGSPARVNPQGLDAQGAQMRAAGPAAGSPQEVPARQIMTTPTDEPLALMGANFARSRHARKR